MVLIFITNHAAIDTNLNIIINILFDLLEITMIKKPQDLSKYDRISIINRHIKDIQQTVYPDNYQEVKQTVVKALEDRIDDIVDGRV